MSQTQILPTATRQRKYTRRSRTGCRTCRTRHIKCDETLNVCENCTSTGRPCDGYDVQRLPFPKKSGWRNRKAPSRLLFQRPTNGSTGSMTSDEKRCFSHFQYRVLPALGDFFDSVLWRKLVLQMGTGERAVSHAAVALSAIYQDIEVSGAPLPGQDLSSNWHYFAMDQAGRSLANLNSRSVSHDPHKQEVVLVCCLLFLLMELLRGRYDEAFHHLRAGLRIVDELKAQRQLVTSPAHESPIEDCLVAAFAQLDIQSAYYGVGGPVLRIEEELPSSSHSDLDLSNPFMSVQEARRAIEPLASRAFPFVSSSWSLPDQEIASDYRRLLMQQQEILSELAQFIENFKDLSTRRYGLLDRKSQKAADIMDILWNTMSVSVRTCLVRDPVALDKFKPEYEISLALVEELFLKYPERPAFTLDMGVLPALFTIAFQCPSYSLRRRSIELLRSWPHREGIYDSQWAVFVAIERMRYELEMQRIREDNMRDLEVSSRSAYPGTDISTELIVDWIQDEKALIVKEMLESSPKCQDYSLEMAMETTKCLRGWSCVQALQTFKSCCTLQNS